MRGSLESRLAFIGRIEITFAMASKGRALIATSLYYMICLVVEVAMYTYVRVLRLMISAWQRPVEPCGEVATMRWALVDLRRILRSEQCETAVAPSSCFCLFATLASVF